MNNFGNSRKDRRRWALAAAATLVVLALIATPVFSRWVRGDWPGRAKAYRQINLSKHLTGNEARIGLWSAPFDLGIIAIHSILLSNGQVLMFQYASTDGKGGILASSYNPSTGVTTVLPVPGKVWNYFCSGDSSLADGRILITGGLYGPQGQGDKGIQQTVVFDPLLMHWVSNPDMHFARYYPTNTQLANGQALIFSGFNTAGTKIVPQVEEYNPTSGTFRTLPSSADLPNAQTWDSYPRMFLLPSGMLFNAGQTEYTWLFDPVKLMWTSVGREFVYGERHGEGAILMPDLKTVMVIGGQQIMNHQKNTPTNTTETIDLSQPTPAWTYGPSMTYMRHDLNAVQLPDLTILVVGGISGDMKYNDPVYQAELYNPKAGSWTVMAAQQGQRGYHSTAILLPDATVFSAGSDSGDSLQSYGEIYSPPYLFNGQRPMITSAPGTLSYATNFTVQTPDAANISSVVLIHNDAATHADHFDQRLIPLTFSVGSGQLTVTAPANGNYAPPGYYMLFIVNSSGVPSVAPIVNVN